MTEDVRITFRPAVVFGLGGMGTFVVTKIKELVEAELARQVALGLISDEVRDEALNTRFQFVGIDSNTEDWSHKVDKFYRIATEVGVAHAMRVYLKQDAFVRWWPPEWENPGEFAFGCGHVRYKGRLAYFLARENRLDIGQEVSDAVGRALQLASQARLPGGATPTVSVFVCTSLSGGTGGGTFLSVLQSIKKLGGALKLYGVVIDSSIAALGARAPTFIPVEYANNWASLIELDAWMSSSPDLLNAVGWRPFWPWEDNNKSIEGVHPVADLVWLFAYTNVKGQQPPNQEAAISQVAETIATWIHSSSTATMQAMDSDVESWIADYSHQTDAAIGRPTQYGSMGIAHLCFPADRVVDYLGAQLAMRAVEELLLTADPEGRDPIVREVDTFLQEEQLREYSFDEILSRFWPLKRSRDMVAPPPIEAILLQEPIKTYPSFKRHVDAAVQNMESEKGYFRRYEQACDVQVTTVLDGRPGEGGGLRIALAEKVRQLLAGSPHGLRNAREFLRSLSARIANQEALSLQHELDGHGQDKGLMNRRKELKARQQNAVKGIPHLAVLPGRVRQNIRSFVGSGWWFQWLGTNEAIIERAAALNLYDALGREIGLLLEALDRINKAITRAAEELRNVEASVLLCASDARRSGLAYEVLTNEDDVRVAFPSPEGAREELATYFLRNESQGVIGGYHAMLPLLRDKAAGTRGALARFEARCAEAERSFFSLLHDEAKRFFKDVERCSIWDALEHQTLAANPAATVDEKLAHIEYQLEPVIASAQPMFPIEEGRLALVGKPDTSIMLVADSDAVAGFGARVGASAEWLTDTISRLLPGAHVRLVNTPDHQRVSTSMRLIGFPLMGMRSQEAAKGREEFEAMENRWRIWSDRRASALPRDFSPIIRSKIEYVAGLALGWGILRHPSAEDGSVDHSAVHYHGGLGLLPQGQVFAHGVKELLGRLELKKQDLTLLTKEVAHMLDDTPQSEWPSKVTQAEDFLSRELEQEKRGSERYDALERLLRVTSQRRSDALMDYDPNHPDEQKLGKLRPEE